MDLVIDLSILIEEDLGKLEANFNKDVWCYAIAWFRKEYSRFMITSSDAYLDAAEKTINDGHSWSCIMVVLKEYLGQYGATKAAWMAFSNIEEKNKLNKTN